MPRTEGYRFINPYASPEPRFIAGYTGYVPGYGPKRVFQMAEPFGRMTRRLVLGHQIAGERLAPILDTSYEERAEEEDRLFVQKHEACAKDPRLRYPIVSGYTGYIPQKKFLKGKCYVPECQEAIARFEKVQTLVRRDQQDHRHEIQDDEECRPLAFLEYPLNISWYDPKIRYNFDHFMVGPNRRRMVYDNAGGYRDWDEMSMAWYKQKLRGNRFSSNEWYQRRMKEAASSNRMSCYDDYVEQPLRNDMPVPWFIRKAYYPEYAKAKTQVALSSDVLLGEERFRGGLRIYDETEED